MVIKILNNVVEVIVFIGSYMIGIGGGWVRRFWYWFIDILMLFLGRYFFIFGLGLFWLRVWEIYRVGGLFL